MLQSFARWFRSPAGIWQTITAVALAVIFEKIYKHADPNGFWLLYWLTVYSAVTQPVLAYVADIAGTKTDSMMNEELRLIKEELQILRHMSEMMDSENEGV